jgi:hypothetical protein
MACGVTFSTSGEIATFTPARTRPVIEIRTSAGSRSDVRE